MTRVGLSLIAMSVTAIGAIYYVHGIQDNRAINHALPILIALIPVVFVDWMKSIVSKRGTYWFTFGTIVFTLSVYAAWITDIGQFASGRSTSGLIFAFLPFYSLIVGCIASFFGMCVTIIIEFRKGDPNKAL